MTDYRVEFSRWWVNEFKSVKFPAAGTVFDYYIDTATQKFVPWSQNVASFELDPDIPLQVRHGWGWTGQMGRCIFNLPVLLTGP